MKKVLAGIIFVFFAFIAGNTNAQYVLKRADARLKVFEYDRAAALYLKAYNKKKTFRAVAGLANSTFLNADLEEAEKWYRILVDMKESTPAMQLRFAEVLRSNGKYVEAKQQYLKYYEANKAIATKDQLSLWSSSCDSSLHWMEHPSKAKISNLEHVNSKYSEWGGVSTEKGFFFISDRPRAGVHKKSFFNFDFLFPRTYVKKSPFKLYQKDEKNLDSLNVEVIAFNFGYNHQYGAVSFSNYGNDMNFSVMEIFRRVTLQKGGAVVQPKLEMYTSKNEDGIWGIPEVLAFEKAGYSIGEPFITQNGNQLFFISDEPGGVGGTDIYVCNREKGGEWGTPRNLTEVNTVGNERTPYVDSAGNLYFSSNGLVGMGGLDIYVAKKNGSSFKKPVNLGFPVNSSLDDFSFKFTNNTDGYFSSNRKGGKGDDDIYMFKDLIHDNTPEIVIATNKGPDTGIVAEDPFKPIDSIIAKTPPVTSTPVSNSIVQKPVGIDTLTTGGIPPTAGGLDPFNPDPIFTPIRDTSAINITALNDVYFAFDSSDLSPTAYESLDELAGYLVRNPYYMLEIKAYTDVQGTPEYNLLLSMRRADSVKRYLLSKGVKLSRMTAVGYGDRFPRNKCIKGVYCTDAEHGRNRRTEFTINR